MLTKEQILNANDLTMQTLNVDEWGGEIHIKSLTGAERSKLMLSVMDAKGNATKLRHAMALTFVLGVCDAQGQPLFTEADIPAIEKKNGKILEDIAGHIKALSGLDVEKKESAENG